MKLEAGTMAQGNKGPVYLAEALEKLIAPNHDKYLVAAAAHLYPKTIQNIVTRRPIAQVTLEKVARALRQGILAPRPYPAAGTSGLSDRLHRFLISMGGTVQAASRLSIHPLILAKLIYGRQVNGRFRAHVQRRLEKVEAMTTSDRIIPSVAPPEKFAEDSLAQCRQAYELYKSHGTLEAVGRRLNLSRERVRQLINRGIAYGVIPAEPHYTQASRPFPFSSREEFLAAYKITPSIRRLVQDLHVSKQRLKRFCRTHAVMRQDLENIRRSSMSRLRDVPRRPPTVSINRTIPLAS
jgi:ribosomal protein S14